MKFINAYSTTAILLFAQSEQKESTIKKIANKKRQTFLLWKKMNERVLQSIKKTNFQYFISDENTQIGNSFGEKITHAIQEVFNKGFTKVIVIGNDCIELNSSLLNEAVFKLQTNDVVLGADYNGGTYLIGVSKTSFNSSKFKIISWKTSTVFEELKQLFLEKQLVFTARLSDCNSTSDFKKIAHRLSFSDSLKRFILSLLQDNTVLPTHSFSLVSYKFNVLNLNKGSPFSP